MAKIMIYQTLCLFIPVNYLENNFSLSLITPPFHLFNFVSFFRSWLVMSQTISLPLRNSTQDRTSISAVSAFNNRR